VQLTSLQLPKKHHAQQRLRQDKYIFGVRVEKVSVNLFVMAHILLQDSIPCGFKRLKAKQSTYVLASTLVRHLIVMAHTISSSQSYLKRYARATKILS